jgi:hypothetical protein
VRLIVDDLRGEVGLDPSRGSGGFLPAAVDYAKAEANSQAAREALAIARRGTFDAFCTEAPLPRSDLPRSIKPTRRTQLDNVLPGVSARRRIEAADCEPRSRPHVRAGRTPFPRVGRKCRLNNVRSVNWAVDGSDACVAEVVEPVGRFDRSGNYVGRSDHREVV